MARPALDCLRNRSHLVAMAEGELAEVAASLDQSCLDLALFHGFAHGWSVPSWLRCTHCV